MSMVSVMPDDADGESITLAADSHFTPLAHDGPLIWLHCHQPQDEARLLLTASSDDGAFQTTQWLKNEQSLASRLCASWAIKPLGHTRYRNRYALLYPSFAFTPLADLITTPDADIARFLQRAISLALALSQAHRQGIVHGDIQPRRFFLNAADESVRLGGFGLALANADVAARGAWPVSAEALPYMSPEHTGRTPHGVHSLSDLYSLGVVLYQLLTGRLPFGTPDATPADWIHHHIASAPRPPTAGNLTVPPMLADILLRLLAKSPVNRYQTIDGLLADLRRCQATLTRDNTIAPFTPGLQESFTASYRAETLYTDHAQAQQLLSAAEETARSGTHSLVVISGAPGAGKSAILASALKTLQHKNLLLTLAKADRHATVGSYGVLTAAFRAVTLYLLGLSAAEMLAWRTRLLQALGEYAGLAVELVPELKQLLNVPPQAIGRVNALDSRARFSQMACTLVSALAMPGRPLVMLLDDVQWADQASLRLLENLFLRSEHLPFMLVLAHRATDAPTDDPLTEFLARIRTSAARVSDIAPNPLTAKAIARWLAERLHARPGETGELAALVHEKTGGNPLFVRNFFRQALEEQLIVPARYPQRWHYDRAALATRACTENVASLVVRQLAQLPVATRLLLGHLACLGSRGELTLLSDILQLGVEPITQKLAPAIAGKFITLAQTHYAFTHDRVHDAAFSLVTSDQTLRLHQQAACLLASAADRATGNETLFRAVYHIARCADAPLTSTQARRYGQLSLRAARRAKGTGDYVSALRYLTTARRFTDVRHGFTLALEEAECEFLQGNLTRAQQLCTTLIAMPGALGEKSAAACLSAEIHMRQSDNHLALETALAWLAVFGIHFNRYPDEAACDAAFQAVRQRLGDAPERLFSSLPLTQDIEKESVMNLIASTIFASSYDCPQLHLLLSCKIIEITLDHGLTGASAFGLAWFSVLISDRYQAHQLAFRCGQLANALTQQHDFTRFKARTLLPLDQVAIWTQPLASAIGYARETFRVAVAQGDSSFACLALRHQIMNMLTRGDHLDAVLISLDRGLAFTRKAFYPDVENVLLMQKRFVSQLRSSNSRHASETPPLTGSEPGLTSGPKAMVQFWNWLYRGMTHFYAEEYLSALRCFSQAERLESAVPGYIYLLDLCFYGALSVSLPLSAHSCAPDSVRELRRRLERVTRWAALNPALFADKAALLRAEVARLEGDVGAALVQYEKAIALSAGEGYAHINALAHELAGRCARSAQMEVTADGFMRNAIAGWDNWGAAARARLIEQHYPHLATSGPPGAFAAFSLTQDETLRDLESMVTAVRALTEEINLDRLIHILMRMLLERAGAQRCLLIRILEGNIPQTEAAAETTADGIRVNIAARRPQADDLPLSVLSAVIRTGKEIRTGQPEDYSPFSQDPYLVASGAAVMCVPMYKQARLVGVLFLENRLMPDAFTAEHSHIVKLLGAQAAVSLETARLYAELLEENIQRRRVEKELRDSQQSLMLGEKISHTGTWHWHLEQDIMLLSEEYTRILGLPAGQKQLSMADFMTRVHPDDAPCIHELVALSVSKGAPMQAEFRIMRPDGEVRYIKGIGEPVANWPELKEYFGTISDITAQRESEDAARIAQAELARVTRVTTVGQLTASIAHEINQPLMSIVANAGAGIRWLSRGAEAAEQVRLSFEEIVGEGKRAGEIIHGLQALTRNHQPVFKSENMHRIAHHIISLSRSELERHQVTVEYAFEARNAQIFCDTIQIQQVLLNLIVNALDAMSAVSDRPRHLTLSSSNPDAQTLAFSVADSGTGMSDAVLEKVFDSFYTTKATGMGMGLAISQGIIKRHQGRLTARRAAPHGSLFQFTLPVEQ